MAELAIDDEAGGELDEGEVVGGLLLPADEQPAEAVEPAVPDLHHPAARRVAVGMRPAAAAAAPRSPWAGCAACSRGRPPSPGTRRSRSPGPGTGAASTLGRRGRAAGRPAGRPASSCRCGWPPTAPAPAARPARRSAGGAWRRTCRGRSGWRPVASGLAGLPFLPSGALTMQPSAACHSHCRPISPSYRAQQQRPGRRQAAVLDPLLQAVVGGRLGAEPRRQLLPLAPVRASQIRPSKIGRSSLRGRPGFLRGLSITRSGWRSAHRASSTSQMRRVVAGGRLRGGGRGAAGAASVAFMARAYHPLSTSWIGCKLDFRPSGRRSTASSVRRSMTARGTLIQLTATSGCDMQKVPGGATARAGPAPARRRRSGRCLRYQAACRVAAAGSRHRAGAPGA